MKEKIGHLAPFGLRMPSRLRGWVEERAEKLDRSMNWVLLKLIEDAMLNENKEAHQ